MSLDEKAATATGTAGAADPPYGAGARSVWASLRPLLLRLHFYAGVFVAPFVVVAALSGVLYVFTPQLDELVYDDVVHVADGPAAVPLAEQVRAGVAARPGDALLAVRPATIGTDATQVIFESPDLPDSYRRTVFVNPHTAEVTGVLETHGSGQALPIRAWVDNLHRGLHMGDVGRLYSELAASWLWVVALGGVALWLSRRRARVRLRSGRGTTGRRKVLSRHSTTGLWIALGLVFLSATGLTWSQYAGANITDLRAALAWETPELSTTLPSAVAGADVGMDQVVSTAREHGFTGELEVVAPSGAGQAYLVQEVGRAWPTQQDSAAIDPSTGSIVELLRFEDYPLMAKLARWGIDAHMGLLFGWVNQVILLALGASLLGVIFWGYRMWWLRGQNRQGFGSPPARGAGRRVPWHVLAPLVVIVAVIGYYVPLLGIPLVAFLAVDVLRGWVKQRVTV